MAKCSTIERPNESMCTRCCHVLHCIAVHFQTNTILRQMQHGQSGMALISINQSNTRRNGHASAASNLAHFNNYRRKQHMQTEKLTEHDHQSTALQLTKWQNCIKNFKWMCSSVRKVYTFWVMTKKSRDNKTTSVITEWKCKIMTLFSVEMILCGITKSSAFNAALA